MLKFAIAAMFVASVLLGGCRQRALPTPAVPTAKNESPAVRSEPRLVDGYYGGLYVSPERDGEVWIVDGNDYFPAVVEAVPGGARLSPIGAGTRPPIWLRRDDSGLCLAPAIDAECEALRDDDPLARRLRSGLVVFNRLDERQFERTGELAALDDERLTLDDGLELSLTIRMGGRLEEMHGVFLRIPDDQDHPRRRLYTALGQGINRDEQGHPQRTLHRLSDRLVDFYVHVDESGRPLLLQVVGYMFVAHYLPQPLPDDVSEISALLR